jgi:hypothetical protein
VSSGLLRFGHDLALLLWDHLSLLISNCASVSLNLWALGVSGLSGIVSLSQFSIVKRAFHRKLNHFCFWIYVGFRIFFFFLLLPHRALNLPKALQVLQPQVFSFVLRIIWLVVNRFALHFLGTCVVIPSFIWIDWFTNIFSSQLSWNEKFVCLFLISNDLWFNSYLRKTCVVLSLVHRVSLVEQVLLGVVRLPRVVSVSCPSTLGASALTVELRWPSQVFGLFASYAQDFWLLAFFLFDVSSWLLVILECWKRFGILLLWSTYSMAWLHHVASAVAALFRTNAVT